MKQSALSHNEELLEKYYAHHERQVIAGKVSPFTGMERVTLETMMNWLCERYTVVSKQRKGKA